MDKTDFVVTLATRVGEQGLPQIRQIARLAEFFGQPWLLAREKEASSSEEPSVIRRRDGGERTLGARFFRCCRRQCWKEYKAGEIASRTALAWFFDREDSDAPGELRGDGKPRRHLRGGAKRRGKPTEDGGPRPKPPTTPARPRLPPAKRPPTPPARPRLPPVHLPHYPGGQPSRPPARAAEPEVYVVRRRSAVPER